MTVAARTAATLREQLRPGDEPAPGPFFRAVSSILDRPWEVALGADQPADSTAPDAEYLARLEGLAAADDVGCPTAVVRVAALVDPPSVLLSPAVRQRVARSVPAPL